MPQTPKIKLKNIQELAKIAKEVIPVVQPYIVKYAPKIAEEAQKRASNAADNGKRMKLEFLNGMEEKKKSRERSKAAEEARKKTVISSLPPITAKEFREQRFRRWQARLGLYGIHRLLCNYHNENLA